MYICIWMHLEGKLCITAFERYGLFRRPSIQGPGMHTNAITSCKARIGHPCDPSAVTCKQIVHHRESHHHNRHHKTHDIVALYGSLVMITVIKNVLIIVLCVFLFKK